MSDPGAGDTRSARKRRVIMEAATSAFLRNGYLGTSMDEIAALAGVSKQTVYKHFADKERLFTDIILATSDQVIGELVQTATQALPDTGDLEKDLAEVGRRLITAICDPQVLRLRRLVIGEAAASPSSGAPTGSEASNAVWPRSRPPWGAWPSGACCTWTTPCSRPSSSRG